MEKLFEFTTNERLFHFLADTTNTSGIEILTPHLTDEKSAVPGGTGMGTGSAPAVHASIALPDAAKSISTPPASTTAGSGDSDPFLKNLFADNKKEKGNDLMFQSLMKSEEKSVETKKSILGELPKIDTSLFIDQEYHLKKQLSATKIGVAALILFGFGLYVFFATQLDPNLDFISSPNLGKRLSTTNEQLKSLQTQVNFNRYSAAKQHLDQFFYHANEFLEKYDAWKTGDESKKAQLLSDLDAAKLDVTKPFEAAREKLSKPLFVTLYREVDPVADRATVDPATAAEEEKKIAVQDFTTALNDFISTNKTKASGDDLRELSELSLMVGNQKLLSLMATDVSKMSDDQLRNFILKVSEQYNQRLAFIFRIKDHRIPWYTIINEIYDKTSLIDNGRFKINLKELGGIRYTGFDFDGATGRITISGNVKDYKGQNFSIMADLIDILEGSSKFKDVQMRNFSKTFAEKDGYDGNFKIDLSLQKSDEVDLRDAALNLGAFTFGQKVPTATPVAPTATSTPASTDNATPVVTTPSTQTTPTMHP